MHKKRRAELVVTMPPANARKKLHGATRIKVAGWLLGKTEYPATAGRGQGRGAGWRGGGPAGAGAGSHCRARGSLHRSSLAGRRGGWRRWNW